MKPSDDRLSYVEQVGYFRLHDHVWIDVVRARMEVLRRLHAVAEAAGPVLPDVEPERVHPAGADSVGMA